MNLKSLVARLQKSELNYDELLAVICLIETFSVTPEILTQYGYVTVDTIIKMKKEIDPDATV